MLYPTSTSKALAALLATLLFTCWIPGSAVRAEEIPEDVDIESLLDLSITSVSKKTQKLSEASSAIYVITSEDIRRSGMLTIPEMLRMVPGLHVARTSGNSWAITSRGFNGLFADKLLVLMDGRSVYDPLFSGVYWDIQDTPLEDIERIEVIRGPGAALYGANAVNGVINIITRTADETQGGLLSGGAGTEERAFATFRYGGKAGEDSHYRIYGKYNNRDSLALADGSDGNDETSIGRAGFRVDWLPTDNDGLTFQGDVYNGTADQDNSLPIAMVPDLTYPHDNQDLAGANLLARWDHDINPTNSLNLQAYWDYTNRERPSLDVKRNTIDLDFDHRFQFLDTNEFVWGLGYRVTSDDVRNTYAVTFDPDSRTDQTFSGFAQIESRFVDDKLHFTLGSKVEHNDYTGWEVQPSARLAYMTERNSTFWGAISRAVRVPSRLVDLELKAQVTADPAFPVVVTVFGDPDVESEVEHSIEFGYRKSFAHNFKVDIATYYNQYENLSTFDQGVFYPEPEGTLPPDSTNLVFPLTRSDNMEGETYGIEITADWIVLPTWTLSAAYTYLHMSLESTGGFQTPPNTPEDVEDADPNHQFNIRSYVELPHNLEWDTMVYWVDELTSLGIDSYTRLDMRLGWNAMDNLRFSIVGQNLLDDQHREFDQQGGLAITEPKRAGYVKVEWTF